MKIIHHHIFKNAGTSIDGALKERLGPSSSTCAVLRRRFSCGCETHPVTFTPTGSNWSSQGGNKLAEASGAEGY